MARKQKYNQFSFKTFLKFNFDNREAINFTNNSEYK